MKCHNCNKEIANDSNFCNYCGTKIVKQHCCPKCGATNLPKESKFCPDCGTPLSIQVNNEQPAKKIQTFNVKGVSFNMVSVVGGSFIMGATPEMQNTREDEKPTHQVTLSSFSIGQTEVTQALWKAVMGNNPSKFKGDNLPVEQVSWDDCQIFISKLNSLTGKNFRLPTEAEWEFAARGGNNSNHYHYSGGNKIDNVAWYKGNSESNTHPVATKKPNELDIYDMSGNVWEWCYDRFSNYSNNSQTNPIGPNNCGHRVCRGGSWNNFGDICRSSRRRCNDPSGRYIDIGFRLCLSE